MKYIKLFENHSNYENFVSGDTMLRPNVSHCIEEDEVHYNPIKTMADEYLTFIALEDGAFEFTPRNGYAISYSIDNGKTWEVPASTTTRQTVSTGSKVMWKGVDGTNTTNSTNGGLLREQLEGIGTFASTGHFEVQGNIMSLISDDSFANADELIDSKGFYGLFENCTGLTSAENLILPATTLEEGCYNSMFYACTSLTVTPKLPATTLAEYCYNNMFAGCTSIITAPELPATTLAEGCYSAMFYGCTRLATAPELPATTLADGCYSYMFYGCTRLTTAPELPATTLANGCYTSMFNGCTSITTAPELSATTLREDCYYYMFNNCTSLNHVKCLATDISANGATTNWLSGVAASGTFIKAASMTSWTTGVNGIPNGWTEQNP